MLLNFITPFLILMRNDTKRKVGTLFFVSLIVFFGHWWDFFYMIKPCCKAFFVFGTGLGKAQVFSFIGDATVGSNTGVANVQLIYDSIGGVF